LFGVYRLLSAACCLLPDVCCLMSAACCLIFVFFNPGASPDLYFEPDAHQHAIITMQTNPPAAIILVGRSGTGKTTTAVHRMWLRHLDDDANALPQLYVTRNSALVDEVRHHAFRYHSFLSRSSRSRSL
jgi:type II secretory pathway predicted ATPase ExeA